MIDHIVYTLFSNGGGMDGCDHNDKGGRVVAAYLNREKANKDPNKPWCTVKPEVVDLEEVAKKALKDMDPVTRLAVDYFFTQQGVGQ